MIPICGRRINSEAKISCAENDMKNLPTILDSERISYPENYYERKENREQRDAVQKTSEEKKKNVQVT